MKNALRAALVVVMGIASVGCCCNQCNNGCNSHWWWHPFCCAGCGQKNHLDWWQNPPSCCNQCDQCGQFHGQPYGSGPNSAYYGANGGPPQGGMVDDGEVIDGDVSTMQAEPPTQQLSQPTPAAARRPLRRTSSTRSRPANQYPTARQYQNSGYYQSNGQNQPPSQYYE
jgi:hypothetical protein